MEYAKVRTYEQVVGCYQHLVDKIGSVRSTLSFPDKDARHVALGAVQFVLTGYKFGLCSMIHKRSMPAIVESFGPKSMSDELALVTVEKAWKLGTLVQAHFHIDSLLQNLLAALRPGTTYRRTFSAHVEAIQLLLNLPEDAGDTLRASAYLRNSLHNNGMHRGDALSVTLHGLEFAFVKDAKVNCGGWSHLLAMLDSCVDTLKSIVMHPIVQALPSPVRDDYAELVGEEEPAK